jgi:hypothetical protein
MMNPLLFGAVRVVQEQPARSRRAPKASNRAWHFLNEPLHVPAWLTRRAITHAEA